MNKADKEYKKILVTIITSMIIIVITAAGTMFRNSITYGVQINDMKKEIEKKADCKDIEYLKEIAEIEKQNVTKDIKELKSDFKEFKQVIPLIQALKDELIPDHKIKQYKLVQNN